MIKNSYFWLSESTFEAGFGPGMAGNPMGLDLSSNGPNLTIEILVSCWPVLFPASTLYGQHGAQTGGGEEDFKESGFRTSTWTIENTLDQRPGQWLVTQTR